MAESATFQQRIKQRYHELSASQKNLAEFILENNDKAAFLTASRLGALVHVSESTVIRFAITLGYNGYPELQEDLQDNLRSKLNMVSRFKDTDAVPDVDSSAHILRHDIANLTKTLNELNTGAFTSAVDEIFKARRIYVVGQRSAHCLAVFLAFYLEMLGKDTRVVPLGISSIFEQFMDIKEGDLVIGISFPRYTRKTLEGLEFAKKQGASTLAITDSVVSPLAQLADITLFVESDMGSFIESLTAPLSVINALVTAVGRKQKEKTLDILEHLEEVWEEYDIFYLSSKTPGLKKGEGVKP